MKILLVQVLDNANVFRDIFKIWILLLLVYPVILLAKLALILHLINAIYAMISIIEY